MNYLMKPRYAERALLYNQGIEHTHKGGYDFRCFVTNYFTLLPSLGLGRHITHSKVYSYDEKTRYREITSYLG